MGCDYDYPEYDSAATIWVPPRFFIWGSGELARTMYYYLSKERGYTVKQGDKQRAISGVNVWPSNHLGLVMDIEHFKRPDWLPLGVNSFILDEHMKTIASLNKTGFFLPIGYGENNKLRETKFKEVSELGFDVLTFLHEKAYIANDVPIGDGSIVLEHCNVQTGAKVGSGCYFWSSFHLGHNSICEDFVFASSNSTVSGNCKVGHNSFIGVGCHIRDGIEIAPYTTLGMGAIITKPTKEYGVYLAGVNNFYKDSRYTDE